MVDVRVRARGRRDVVDCVVCGDVGDCVGGECGDVVVYGEWEDVGVFVVGDL